MPAKLETIYRLPCSVDSVLFEKYLASSSSISSQSQINQSQKFDKKYLANIKDISQKRVKAASRMTINKFISSPGIKTQPNEKIILPKPRQISNTISFSLQMEVDEDEIGKMQSLNQKQKKSNEISRSQSSLNQQSNILVNPKKSIKKPVIKKTFM